MQPIDVNRPLLWNDDGSFSTEETITITVMDGKKELYVTIPTIVDGKRHSQEEAIKLYEQGKNYPVDVQTSLEQAIKNAQQRTKMIPVVRGMNVGP